MVSCVVVRDDILMMLASQQAEQEMLASQQAEHDLTMISTSGARD